MILSRATKSMRMADVTSYGSEYFEKDFSKPEPIYSATNSGFRRNNPHPSREFLEWKIPRGGCKEKQVVLNEDKVKEVFRKQLVSSYQTDFMGTQPEEAEGIEERMSALRTASRKGTYTETSMRQSYDTPKMNTHLQGNTTRYGCNLKKGETAVGIMPTVQRNPQSLKVKSDTSYTSEFSSV